MALADSCFWVFSRNPLLKNALPSIYCLREDLLWKPVHYVGLSSVVICLGGDYCNDSLFMVNLRQDPDFM